MKNALRKFIRQGAIRIPREKERAIYFYATVVLVIVYLLHRLPGSG